MPRCSPSSTGRWRCCTRSGFSKVKKLFAKYWSAIQLRDRQLGIAAILIGNTFAGNATAQDAQKAREAIQRGRLTGAKTERERYYIEAIAEYYDRFNDRPHGARMKSLADAFKPSPRSFRKMTKRRSFMRSI